MADSKKTDATPTAVPASDPTAPVPSAGGEPAKQATASTAKPAPAKLPPAPADYEMPDDYADDWVTKTKRWVEANPVLAMVTAAGAGLVAARIVTALLPDPEPPTFAARVEKRARQLRKNAAHYADDAGDTLSHQLKRASSALSDAADAIAGKAEVGFEKSKDLAEAGYEKSKDLAEVVADATKAAVAGVVAQKADSWLDRLRK